MTVIPGVATTIWAGMRSNVCGANNVGNASDGDDMSKIEREINDRTYSHLLIVVHVVEYYKRPRAIIIITRNR